jgi:excisionase family DNA binding protein
MNVTDSPWLRLPEAAEYLQRGKRFLSKEVRAGRLRAAYVGGKRELYFRREWLDEYVTSLATPVEVFRRRAS